MYRAQPIYPSAILDFMLRHQAAWQCGRPQYARVACFRALGALLYDPEVRLTSARAAMLTRLRLALDAEMFTRRLGDRPSLSLNLTIEWLDAWVAQGRRQQDAAKS